MGHKLLVLHPDQCVEIPFDQQLTIGRDVYNSLSLQDPEVSRSHAIIFEQEGQVIIKDLRSRNGVYVRGDRVSESTLQSCDEIILGATVIIYDPTDTLDVGQCLSKRGRYLLEKRLARLPSDQPAPQTVFTLTEMEGMLEAQFSGQEGSAYFNPATAMSLLQIMREMDRATDSPQLFELTLRRTMDIVGAHRGAIMEADEQKEHLKVRALRSEEDTDTLLIGQPVLKIVLTNEKCVYCPNVLRDKRFEGMATHERRDLHSFMATPVHSGSELFGLIYLDSQDASIAYDLTALRTLYCVASHLGSLLRRRPLHFQRQPQEGAMLRVER